jgi:hypothetical protein
MPLVIVPGQVDVADDGHDPGTDPLEPQVGDPRNLRLLEQRFQDGSADPRVGLLTDQEPPICG